MKKAVTILIVIAVVLALTAAGFAGYVWYKSTHVFVEGDAYPLDASSLDLRDRDITLAYFDQLHSLLPGCDILWNVPFQGKTVPSDTHGLTISSISQEDMGLMKYFPSLERINAQDCTDYVGLAALQKAWPKVEVAYEVDMGGVSFAPDTQEAELAPGEYDYDTLMENLQYLPQLQTLLLHKPELTTEQLDGLKAAYEGLDIQVTVELRGQEWSTGTEELDLSGLTVAEVSSVCEKLALLPQLKTVELMDGSGACDLSPEDVRQLKQAAPQASFHYSFDFYGTTVTTQDEEVNIKNQKIGDENIDQVRAVLDILENCRRFVLENCKISNENMAQLREDYREKTKVVWRVYFGLGSCMTDVTAIRAVYDLTDDNSQALIYCEDVKYIDMGHNEYLDAVPFVAGMPNLEYMIVSGAPIKDLTPFANCKQLKFLELAFCGLIEDLSPLASCESLEKLNIANTKVTDLSPVAKLPLTHLTLNDSAVPKADREAFAAAHPDCLVKDTGNPYGYGWRYANEENTEQYPHYEMLAKIFDYKGNAFNHTGIRTELTLEDFLTEQTDDQAE
ncbi:MAG: leucine-rich repeat domain-containing protein [Eubacteriales bacterium]|nr:leucine-rich repeat domain-containing protein [Eubacteriales bacterium]